MNSAAIAKLLFQSSDPHSLDKLRVEPCFVHVQLDGTGALFQLRQCARAFFHCVRSAGYPAAWQVSLVSGDFGRCCSGIKGRAGMLTCLSVRIAGHQLLHLLELHDALTLQKWRSAVTEAEVEQYPFSCFEPNSFG